MNVVLNGERREVAEGATVDDAVTASGAPESRRGVAVAVDGHVIPRGQWASTTLGEGQSVEVLHAVQGG